MYVFRKFASLCLSLAVIAGAFAGCSARECATIDNDTPFVYVEPENQEVILNGETYDILLFTQRAQQAVDAGNTKDLCYESFAKYFGHQPLRSYQDSYYTIYPIENNQLLYLLFQKVDKHYVLNSYCLADFRDDSYISPTLDKDLPSVILGDKKPDFCYLDYYSQEEIDEQNAYHWQSYQSYVDGLVMDADNIPKQDDVLHIRCLEYVCFDVTVLEYVYSGVYAYDIYVYPDGTGSLYFSHHYEKYISPDFTYNLLQDEVIPLSKEEVSTLQRLLDAWDFANYPTWNPEEMFGVDGETTMIYARGDWGENLICMWCPLTRYPHHQIRTAIEDIVRAHITVNQGRIYCPEE